MQRCRLLLLHRSVLRLRSSLELGGAAALRRLCQLQARLRLTHPRLERNRSLLQRSDLLVRCARIRARGLQLLHASFGRRLQLRLRGSGGGELGRKASGVGCGGVLCRRELSFKSLNCGIAAATKTLELRSECPPLRLRRLRRLTLLFSGARTIRRGRFELAPRRRELRLELRDTRAKGR